ncbi:MAG: DCC1-like thiol-disulfide oxidoreductase family protein [Opitutaceae bacterium]|nr:DCC1-like thiol-disulfide oxidoreductase family protein [Opitutaceae bacterium]
MRFLLRRDRRAVLRFAPLQSPLGRRTLERLGLPTGDFDSLVFLPGLESSAPSLRTDGVAEVLQVLGGGWAVVGRTLRRVPAGWRDAAYRLVARLRYRLFGEYTPKPLPVAAWAERFLE